MRQQINQRNTIANGKCVKRTRATVQLENDSEFRVLCSTEHSTCVCAAANGTLSRVSHSVVRANGRTFICHACDLYDVEICNVVYVCTAYLFAYRNREPFLRALRANPMRRACNMLAEYRIYAYVSRFTSTRHTHTAHHPVRSFVRPSRCMRVRIIHTSDYAAWRVKRFDLIQFHCHGRHKVTWPVDHIIHTDIV